MKLFVVLLTLALQGCGFGKIATAIEEAQTEVICTSGLYKLQYTPEQICEKCKNIENRERYCE